jgi:hypothetical protein
VRHSDAVYQNVNLRKGREHRRGNGFIGNIANVGDAAHLARDLLGIRRMDIEDVDGRAFARKVPGNRRADSPCASRDYGSFPGKFQSGTPRFQIEVYFVGGGDVKRFPFT